MILYVCIYDIHIEYISSDYIYIYIYIHQVIIDASTHIYMFKLMP